MTSNSYTDLKCQDLRNTYFCMRHGRSLANEAGLIISDLVTGSRGWGLAPGAERSVVSNASEENPGSDTLIISSPFKRASETANIVAEYLSTDPPVIAEELRERWFGKWEGSSHDNYTKVWELDKSDIRNTCEGVESPLGVLNRLQGFLSRIESRYTEKKILLVSHGDPLDILLTWAGGKTLTAHMYIGMTTAEIRPLIR